MPLRSQACDEVLRYVSTLSPHRRRSCHLQALLADIDSIHLLCATLWEFNRLNPIIAAIVNHRFVPDFVPYVASTIRFDFAAAVIRATVQPISFHGCNGSEHAVPEVPPRKDMGASTNVGEVISGLIPIRSVLTPHALEVRTRHTLLTSWTAPAGIFAENIAQIQEFWGCGNAHRRDKPMTSVLKPGEIRAANLAAMRKTSFFQTGNRHFIEAGGELTGRGGRTATLEVSSVRWRDAALSRARVAVQRAQWHISFERAQSGFASSL